MTKMLEIFKKDALISNIINKEELLVSNEQETQEVSAERYSSNTNNNKLLKLPKMEIIYKRDKAFFSEKLVEYFSLDEILNITNKATFKSFVKFSCKKFEGVIKKRIEKINQVNQIIFYFIFILNFS